LRAFLWKKRDLAYLKSKARKVREGIVRAIGVGQKGHLGGSNVLRPIWSQPCIFTKAPPGPITQATPIGIGSIFSKGHSVLAQYARASLNAATSQWEALPTTKQLGSLPPGTSRAGSHTGGSRPTPGSLGQGLSIGLGMGLRPDAWTTGITKCT